MLWVRATLLACFSCCGPQAVGTWPSIVAACGFNGRGVQVLGHTVVLAHRLSSCGLWAPSTGLVVVTHWISCSTARGIFLDQESNLCPLHWQVDSDPLYPKVSPRNDYWYILNLKLCSVFALQVWDTEYIFKMIYLKINIKDVVGIALKIHMAFFNFLFV